MDVTGRLQSNINQFCNFAAVFRARRMVATCQLRIRALWHFPYCDEHAFGVSTRSAIRTKNWIIAFWVAVHHFATRRFGRRTTAEPRCDHRRCIWCRVRSYGSSSRWSSTRPNQPDANWHRHNFCSKHRDHSRDTGHLSRRTLRRCNHWCDLQFVLVEPK